MGPEGAAAMEPETAHTSAGGKHGRKGQGRAKGAAKPNLYDEVTARIITELEAGRAPWVQPTNVSEPRMGATYRCHYSSPLGRQTGKRELGYPA